MGQEKRGKGAWTPLGPEEPRKPTAPPSCGETMFLWTPSKMRGESFETEMGPIWDHRDDEHPF